MIVIHLESSPDRKGDIKFIEKKYPTYLKAEQVTCWKIYIPEKKSIWNKIRDLF